MTLNKQLRHPDSCSCIFEEIWDSDDIQKEHVLSKFIYMCKEHDNPSIKDVYKTVVRENAMKNLLVKHITENNALSLNLLNTRHNYDRQTKTKSTTYSLHGDIIYNYYFTGDNPNDRTIVFSLEGLDKNGNVINLTNTEKVSVNSILDKHLGYGRHRFVDLLHEDLHPEYRAAVENRKPNKDSHHALNRFREETESEQKRQQKQNKLKDFFSK